MNTANLRHFILLGGAVALFAIPAAFLWPKEQNISKPLAPVVTKIVVLPPPKISALLEKPLFNSERAAIVREEAAEPAQLAETQTEPPSLVGVVMAKRGKAIAIVRGRNGKEINIRSGQSVDGWTLASLQQGAAIFKMSGRSEKVKLDFGNSAIGGPVEMRPPLEQNENVKR